MALTGQLSDMSLAELIEFFCNQRKTGRLKIDYPRGHSVFFIKDGELVDAKVGSLSGADAVYFSLTLPNAAFDFSPDVNPTRQTIRESWTQVVLEGLRRLDEGISPTEADAFGGWTPSDAEMSLFMDQVDRLGESGAEKDAGAKNGAETQTQSASSSEVPLALMVDGAQGGGKKKWMVLGVAACVVLAVGVAAIPLSGRLGSKTAASAAANPTAASEPVAPTSSNPEQAEAANNSPAESSSDEAHAEASSTDSAAADSALAARRLREEREREARERERRERERKADEQAKKTEDAAKLTEKPAAPVAPVATGPKSVRVSVSYDEAGRVTQASVAGTTPGAEAYGGTAVRIARGRRFPAGKAGSAVVTIPVN